MPKYQNGRVPMSALIRVDDNAKHLTSPKAAGMFYRLRVNVQRNYGKVLHITPGWNAYRPYSEQEKGRKDACAAGNCDAAAVPGWSSHGGTWIDQAVTGGKWIDALAFDIGDYGQIGQAAFYAEAKAAGFVVGAITVARAGISEPWHIIVLDPWGPVTANASGVVVDRPVIDVQRVVGATADHYWGKGTEDAVKAWQKANGLDPDGVWGATSDARAFGGGAAASVGGATQVTNGTAGTPAKERNRKMTVNIAYIPKGDKGGDPKKNVWIQYAPNFYMEFTGDTAGKQLAEQAGGDAAKVSRTWADMTRKACGVAQAVTIVNADDFTS